MKPKKAWIAQYDGNRKVFGYCETKHGQNFLHLFDTPAIPATYSKKFWRYLFKEVLVYVFENGYEVVYSSTWRDWQSAIEYEGFLVLPINDMKRVKRTKLKVSDFDKAAAKLT